MKDLVRLRRCISLPEPLLFAFVISTFFTRAGSFLHKNVFYSIVIDRLLACHCYRKFLNQLHDMGRFDE